MSKDHNLHQRGRVWWWRKKVRLGNFAVPLAFSLDTPDIIVARRLRDRLSCACEELVMAYGVYTETMSEAQCKAVFTDAMRKHLTRVLADTLLDGKYMAENLYTNEIFEVINTLLADNVPKEQLADAFVQEALVRGWPEDAYGWGLNEFNRTIAHPDVGKDQLERYATAFGIKPTTTNEERMVEEIRRARAAAFVEVNKRLRSGLHSRRPWVDEAMADTSAIYTSEKAPEREESDPQPYAAPRAIAHASTLAPVTPAPTPAPEMQTSKAPEVGGSEAYSSQSFSAVAASSPSGPAASNLAPVSPPIADANPSSKRITAVAMMEITVVRKKLKVSPVSANGPDLML